MNDQTKTILSKEAYDKFKAAVDLPAKRNDKLAELMEKRKVMLSGK